MGKEIRSFEDIFEKLDEAFEGFGRWIDGTFVKEGPAIHLDRDFFIPSVRRQRSYRVHKEKDKTTIEVDLPGVKLEDVSITAIDGLITIGWKRRIREESADGHLEFHISRGADIGKISAKLADGVLTVIVPKSDRDGSEPKTIRVSV